MILSHFVPTQGGEQKVDVPLEDVSKPEKLVGAGLKLAGVPALAASGFVDGKEFPELKELNNRPLNSSWTSRGRRTLTCCRRALAHQGVPY